MVGTGSPRDSTGHGERLGGYLLERRLGAGAFGVVYRARHENTGRLVALKLLRETEPDNLYRFKREYRIASDVRHPNLVRLHELSSDGERWFFTMEWVDGVGFLDWVRPDGLDEARLRDAFAQLVTALEALHERGLHHRDLKPANVMVDRRGQVKVLDFGLVHRQTELESDRSTVYAAGTPAYMAPEQATGVEPTPAADWYAVGAMLFEALTGQRPFHGPAVKVLVEKQQKRPPDPRALAPDAPEDLSGLCRSLLEPRPDLRAGAAEIRQVIGVAPPPATPPVPTGEEPFLGRAPELAALEDAFAHVARGRRVVIHVAGVSGMGKSVLLRRFARDVEQGSGAVVVHARCHERESVPFKAVDGLVDALSRYLKRLPADRARALLPRDPAALVRLFPVLGRVEALHSAPGTVTAVDDPHEQRRRGFQAVRELLARLAAQQPIVLLLDDLQWGDADSADLLAEVLAAPDPPAVLLVCAYRADEADRSEFVRRLRKRLPYRELPLTGLADDDARKLASMLLENADPETLDAIVSESRGSPFFIAQFARHAGSAGAAAGGLSLQAVLTARIDALPPEARRLVEIVAVAAGPVPLAVALIAAGLSNEAKPIADQLSEEHLLRVQRGGGRSTARDPDVEVWHDRIREVVIAALDAAALRRHHAALARALEADGRAPPELLAEHLLGSGDRARAAAHLVRAAGEAAGQLAFDRAAALYRKAMASGATEAPDGEPLPVRLADALARAGHNAEAAAAYLRAADELGDDRAHGLRRQAADQYLRGGYLAEGLEAWRGVLQPLGLRLPRATLGALVSAGWRRLLARLSGLKIELRREEELDPGLVERVEITWAVAQGLGMIDPIRTADFQTRSLLLALESGHGPRVARALALEAVLRAVGGPRGQRQARTLFDRVLPLALIEALTADLAHAA